MQGLLLSSARTTQPSSILGASNMQAPMHLSTAQPIALAGRTEGSRLDCNNADRGSLKSASCFQSRHRSSLHAGSHGTKRKSGKPGAQQLARDRMGLFQYHEQLGSDSKLHEGVRSSTTIIVPVRAIGWGAWCMRA